MGVSQQLAKTIQKIGVSVVRQSQLFITHYIDIGSSYSTSNSWTRNFVRPFTVKGDSTLEAGDIIFEGTVTSHVYLIASIDTEVLLGQAMYKYGNLYIAESVLYFYRDEGERDSETLEYVPDWNVIISSMYSLIVKQRLDLEEGIGSLIEDGLFYAYIPSTGNIYISDRVTCNEVNYKIRSIDEVSLPGLMILQLDLDTR